MNGGHRAPVAVEAAAARGAVLFGALFRDTPQERPETVVFAITGIHGNFCSNPFYVDFGAAVNAAGAHFVYAQTCDAFGEIPTRNVRTGAAETAGRIPPQSRRALPGPRPQPPRRHPRHRAHLPRQGAGHRAGNRGTGRKVERRVKS